MMDYLRDLRLLPIAVVASACLLALTAADLLLDRADSSANDASVEASIVHVAPDGSRQSDSKQSDSKQSDSQQSDSKQSWAQQMFNFPSPSGTSPPPVQRAAPPPLPRIAADKSNADLIVTGSISGSGEDKTEAKPKGEGAAATGKDGKPASPAKEGQPSNMNKDATAVRPPEGTLAMTAAPPPPAPMGAERVLLERLSERRQELDKRARELDIREGLITEAEKRVDARLAEIKDAKAQLAVAVQQKDEAEVARFKGLVTMYETMKPRDAAKIFDRLEIGVLIEVASQISPRSMSEILALMSPDTAERLTVELANRAKTVVKDPNADLPKIEGRPGAQ